MEAQIVRSLKIGIVLLCIIAFSPVFKADFVYYDDPEYVINNRYIKEISVSNISAIFAGKATLLYVPLTLLSYMVDQLLGGKPFVFHIINLLLHILNSLLLLRIILKLNIKSIFPAAFILLFFTVSPLVTESVCWITERKDVLYSCFYFLAALKFLDYMESKRFRELALSFLFFVLACLSKPMAVTLPVLLMIYALYRFGKESKPYIVKLLPFFLVSLLFSLLTLYMMNSEGAHKTQDLHYGFGEKIVLMASAIGFYFFKPFLPFGQRLIYLFPSTGEVLQRPEILFYAGAAILVLLVFLYFLFRKKDRLLFSLFICWFALIIPLLQVDTNNHSYVNERYLYLSLVFPAAIVFLCLERLQLSPSLLKNGMICLAILFSVLTIRRAMSWKNTLSLFTQELKVLPENPYALNNLGFYYNEAGEYQKGREVLLKALHYRRDEPTFLNNYGWALSELDQVDSAMVYFKEAVALDKNYVSALNNLGVCYSRKMMKDSAGLVFQRAYDLDRDNHESNFYMGVYHNFIGKPEEARPFFVKAKKLGNKKAEKYL